MSTIKIGILALVGVLVLFTAEYSFNNYNKTKQLEKENQNLQARLDSNNLDSQAQCSRDARNFFDSQKSTTGSYSFQNHYSKSLNKCFILVTRYWDTSTITSFSDPNYASYQDLYLADIYENVTIGRFSRELKNNKITTCEISGEQCDSYDNFMNKVNSYLNN